jgi:2-polyprenyl-3-methyl-5-hydroxy-6-metoxy-1,4-benzoquinol methylase
MSRSYYSNMLDVEGLDRELSAEPDKDPGTALLRHLFSVGRLDLVELVISKGAITKRIAEKVRAALVVKQLIFKSLVGDERALNSTPRALAEEELLMWRPSSKRQLRDLLAVESPVRKDWIKRRVRQSDSREVVEFYEKTDSYIWELMAANNIIETLYNYAVTLRKMRRVGIREFLDYGAGIGSFVIAASESDLHCTHMDLSSPTFDFARWRYEKRNIQVPMLIAKGDHTDIPKSTSIVCTEVVEHVPDPLALLDAFEFAIPKGGYLIVSESCKDTEKFIAHLPQNRWLGGKRFDYELKRRRFNEVWAEPRVKPRVFRKR